MFNENTTKQIFAAVLLAILLIFSYMIIKPIFFAAILGLILAYIFRPINKWLLVRIKQPTVTALITCIVVLGALVAITWAFLPILTRQLIEGYSLIQSFDMVGLIKRVFPFLFLTEGSVKTFASAYNTLVSQVIQSSVGSTSDWVKELPSIALKLFVVLIAFFYGLRDGDKMVSILKDTLPFNKSIISRFITKSELVTNSIVYGRVIIGV